MCAEASTILRAVAANSSLTAGIWSSLELYSVSPDWFEYSFIYEKFVACGEF
jgi:hypothetical protein